MVSGALLLTLYTYPHETSHTNSTRVNNDPCQIWGQKGEGQGHNAWITENGFWLITATHYTFHHET